MSTGTSGGRDICSAPWDRGCSRVEVGSGSGGGDYSYTWRESESSRPYTAYVPPSVRHGAIAPPEYRGIERAGSSSSQFDGSINMSSSGKERKVVLSDVIIEREVGIARSLFNGICWGIWGVVNLPLEAIGLPTFPEPADLRREAAEAIIAREDAEKADRLREMLDKGDVLGDIPKEEREKMTLCARAEPVEYKDPDNDVTHRNDGLDGINGGRIVYNHDIDRMVYYDRNGNAQSIANPSDRDWMDQFAQVYGEAKGYGAKSEKSETPEPNWIERWKENRQATADDYKKVGSLIVDGVVIGTTGGVGSALGTGKAIVDMADDGAESAAKVVHDVGSAYVECRVDAEKHGVTNGDICFQ